MIRPSNPTPLGGNFQHSNSFKGDLSSESEDDPDCLDLDDFQQRQQLKRQVSISDLIASGQADPFKRQYDQKTGLLKQPSLSDLMDFDIDSSDLQRDLIQTPFSTINTTTDATAISTSTSPPLPGANYYLRQSDGTRQRPRPNNRESRNSLASTTSTFSTASNSSDDDLRRELPPAASMVERPSNPIPWYGGGRKSAWMDDDDLLSNRSNSSSVNPDENNYQLNHISKRTESDHGGSSQESWYDSLKPSNSSPSINPATSVTLTPNDSSTDHFSIWKIEEADAIENQKKFDRSVARIVELAMEADISSRFDDGEVNDEKEMVFLQNKLDRAYGMMCKYFNEGENGGLLYLPGVFKVLIRACLSHQQIDRSLDIYNKALKSGVVLSDHEFQKLCKALEDRDRNYEMDMQATGNIFNATSTKNVN